MTKSTGAVVASCGNLGLKHQASQHGDIEGVLDEIGDDLESVMGGMVPRCEVCGLQFLATDKIVICGMTKAHLVGVKGVSDALVHRFLVF